MAVPIRGNQLKTFVFLFVVMTNKKSIDVALDMMKNKMVNLKKRESVLIMHHWILLNKVKL